MLLTDGERLSLYRWEAQALAWRWDEEGRGGRRILSLDAADVDGDGRSEVLVSAVVRGRVVSELRRWQDNALRVAATIDGVYLRAAPRPGAPALLLGQRSGIDEVLIGRVEQYRLGAGAFEKIEGSALPRGVGIFGLALAPAGGPVALYALDRGGYISGLNPAGAVLWRSARTYGGYPTPLTASELFGPGGVTDDQDFEEEARAFQGRLLAEASRRRRSARRSPEFQRLSGGAHAPARAGAGGGRDLRRPRGSPEEVHRSRAFDGYVADLARGDIDGDGNAEILFVVNRVAGVLSGERGKLVAWRPAGAPGEVK